MNKFFKALVLTGAVAATTLSTIPAANAGDRGRHSHRHQQSSGSSIGPGEIAAIGIFGLAAGIIAASAANGSSPRGELIGPVDGPDSFPQRPAPRQYYRDRDSDRYRDRDRYSSVEPWSPGWYRYCSNRYQTFNPRTGTYTGYDGRDHFCNAG